MDILDEATAYAVARILFTAVDCDEETKNGAVRGGIIALLITRLQTKLHRFCASRRDFIRLSCSSFVIWFPCSSAVFFFAMHDLPM